MSDRPRPTLTISNFGPIKTAEIELRPLTVFIGPNNSGKSYVALLAYALSQALSGEQFRTVVRNPRVYSSSRFGMRMGRMNLDDATTTTFRDLPTDIRDEAYARVKDVREGQQADILESLHDYFATESLSDLVRSGASKRLHVAVNGKPTISVNFSAFADKGREAVTLALPSQDLIDAIPVPAVDSLRNFADTTDASTLSGIYAVVVIDQLLGRLGFAPGAAFYLPSARSGILQGWTVLASLAVQALRRRIGLDRIEVAPFSGVTSDFLELLIEMMAQSWYRQLRSDQLAPALQALEDSLLGGEIQIADPATQARPALTYVSGKRRVPLHRASSMVAELAPLDLWLKHLVQPGDLLIIDEPEAHLHPETQRHIARVIVRLVRAGVRIICPTHSSLILHQLSNHLLASAADEATRIELGYTSDDLLTHDDIGVYLFDLADDGSVVSPVSIDPEFGISEDEFVRVSEAIGEESYRLTTAMALT